MTLYFDIQAGAMVMVEIFNYLREHPTNHFNIVGTIFDSGPFNTADNYIAASQKALVSSLNNPSKASKWLCNQAAGIFARISNATDEFTRNFDSNIRQYPSLAPQLFLTSRADKIVDFQDVVDLAEKRREKGVPVYVKIWDTGDHVELLRTHKEEYTQTIKDFIDVCIPKSVPQDKSLEKILEGQKWLVELE